MEKIKTNLYILTFAFLVCFVFLVPAESFAGGATGSWEVDAPSQINVDYKYPWADATSPADFISKFYRIALGVVGGAALGVLVYGAILWTVSGAVSTKQDAMEWIWAAIWGLILLLGAYLILNTINPDLVKLKNPDQLLMPGTTDLTPLIYAAGGLQEEQARQMLAASGIGTKDVCPIGQSTGCVNLNGIRPKTIDEVLSLVLSVGNDNVFVTAGTEGCGTVHAVGVYSHCNGYKVDLRLNANLNNYITQNFQKISNRTSDGAARYVSPSGAVYALENDHWDILVT
ncbi:hypothetical protein COY31_00500 [Candidatus Wolfebacteria bacterium CG_4_10_14_0_2_um_filter_39_18]|uniref:Uncharacterized protein n=1 Tax=Candidatus Wolfebacteria bacterium CG_4_10_14_0_2_um_filter_39_18 TaxID=1975061 RepID=A0A2M7TGT9_9BACT|nr:MAG: hypothetical protein COY31_00500 [Candidatus Wolfebacteria bacterium CG_4_10_14_0_2_um_filter_39_18]